MWSSALINKNKSTLVQIMNELDNFSPEELDYILHWLKVKKATPITQRLNNSVLPNNLTLDDIYAERDAMRKEKRL